ncbi:MAG: VOC family protein [Alphaproteobacteria bacterium]
MSHKSRLAGLCVDCHTDDLEAAARFWSAALGYAIKRSDDPAEANYVGLDSSRDGLGVEVQQVDHDSRVHLDIETDDIEAEAARLEALGAKRVAAIRTWLVMEAPTGQRFCLVRPQNAGFEDKANRWD